MDSVRRNNKLSLAGQLSLMNSNKLDTFSPFSEVHLCHNCAGFAGLERGILNFVAVVNYTIPVSDAYK